MTNQKTGEPVLLSIKDGVAILTLNNASQRNSVNAPMAAALSQRLDEIEAVRDSLKGLLLIASGDHFCVGGDIRYFETLLGQPEAMRSGLGALISDLNRAVARIDALPFPVIALVQGAAAGAGLSLALASDIVIAADDARFVMAYSGLGATPDGGGSWSLPRRVGQQLALYMYLFNDPLDAEQARAAGLVAQVVSRSALEETTKTLAQRLAKGSRPAQNAGKALMRSGMQTSLETALQHEKSQFLELATQSDFDEGVKAFRQKRPPHFTL